MTIIVRLPVVTYGIARYLFISRLLCHVFERSLWPLSPPRSRALDIACLLLPLHLEHRHVQRLIVSSKFYFCLQFCYVTLHSIFHRFVVAPPAALSRFTRVRVGREAGPHERSGTKYLVPFVSQEYFTLLADLDSLAKLHEPRVSTCIGFGNYDAVECDVQAVFEQSAN